MRDETPDSVDVEDEEDEEEDEEDEEEKPNEEEDVSNDGNDEVIVLLGIPPERLPLAASDPDTSSSSSSLSTAKNAKPSIRLGIGTMMSRRRKRITS